ncbi:hypothetical protein HMPREF9333_00356 [Johnsonella ignava ATCC 51276]|uniref:Acyltransferase 3 domain-containing protein n=1 Tax=Johnsonella ignava ATCC 51276 TaxID=679200 RepID=G5GFL7_9FIRM|nr:acyltransferase family protein [Johnsonella ignava]EHI56494.1 hypothetical protein HMPREF9333_00356 [Johnsonella ignava ATCC 51276]
MTEKKAEKIYFLNGIKGMSAIIVVIYHLLSAVYPPIINKTALIRPESLFLTKIGISPLNIFFDGDLAVAFFFLISGFFNAKTSFNTEFNGDSGNFIKKYLALEPYKNLYKRYIRLTPYIFISVMLIYISLKTGLNKSHELAQAAQSGWLFQFYNEPVNLGSTLAEALYGNVFFGVCKLNPILWCMHYILLGSCCVVITVAIVMGRDSKHRAMIYTALFTVTMLARTYISVYFIAVALYDYYNERDNIKIPRYIYMAALFVGLFFASYPAEFPTDNTVYAVMSAIFDTPVFWHYIGAALIIFAFFGIEELQKFMSCRILLFLGDISYEIYILGFLLQNTVFASIFLYYYNKGYYGRGFLIATVVTFALLIILSVILKKVYYNFEKICTGMFASVKERLLNCSFIR